LTSSFVVLEAATWVKSMYMAKSWFKTRKKWENMDIKEIFT